MKKNLKLVMVFAGLSILVVSISSCSLLLAFGLAPDISGTVVDAYGAGTSFQGATVTLSNLTTGKTYTTSVASDNTWSVDSVKDGTYIINVSNGSYYFFTQWTAPITYNGGSVTAPNVGGVYTPYLNQGSYSYVTFILMWNNSQELDLAFTGPDPAKYGNGGSLDFTSPSYDPTYNSSIATIWDEGFGPNGAAASSGPTNTLGRLYVTNTLNTVSSTYMQLRTYTTTGGFGPDAILLKNYPTQSVTSATSSGNGFYIYGSNQNFSQLLTNETGWEGVGMFYIDAPTGYISTSSSTTNATLYVVQANSDGTPDLLGVYTVPTNTPVETISALRMNIMTNEFQMVPDMQTVTPGYFRAAGGSTPSGVVSVRRGPTP